MSAVTETIRNWWSAMIRPSNPAPQPGSVIVHDPAADGPKDLDDPFVSADVQARMARVISDSARGERTSSH